MFGYHKGHLSWSCCAILIFVLFLANTVNSVLKEMLQKRLEDFLTDLDMPKLLNYQDATSITRNITFTLC